METVCPLPKHWHEIYQRLRAACEADERSIPPPPVPLILGGWAFSNDVQKRARWHATTEWADRWGLTHLLGELHADMMYRVDALTDHEVGPFGGPVYLPWHSEPRPDVSGAAAAAALATLNANWGAIAGPELSNVTRPLGLTGAKRRRLVVAAKGDATPPWGTWETLASGDKRRHFTRFRAAVNAAIAPLEVDHIDFVHEQSQHSNTD